MWRPNEARKLPEPDSRGLVPPWLSNWLPIAYTIGVQGDGAANALGNLVYFEVDWVRGTLALLNHAPRLTAVDWRITRAMASVAYSPSERGFSGSGEEWGAA